MLEIPNKEEFSKLFKSKMSYEKLAEEYFVSPLIISNWVKHFKLSRKKYPEKNDIEELLKNKTTQIEMAKKLGCSTTTLITYIKKYGLEVSKTVIDVKEMYELRVNCKWTFEELAELYKTSNQMIQDRCRQNGFPKVKVAKQTNLWQREKKSTCRRGK